MKSTPLLLPEVILLSPKIFDDKRGFFFESFNQQVFNEIVGRQVTFVQDNHSKSSKGVLRGLHYQLPPKAQGKLVRIIQGEIFDVVVDVRKHSPTFGQSVTVILSAENKNQLWVPPGFAHGFLTLSDTAELLYKTTDYYAPEHERCIQWNDAALSINWPIETRMLTSDKDGIGTSLEMAEVFA